MTNQSITNKLVANIRQANDISKNFFTDTNRVVCIDTSNTRIGINTKTPQWSIDISGDGSYNGVKCHNLDISGRADISYAQINFLKAPTISADFIDISNGYFKKIDASLIDISEVLFNSISGDFIYSKECTIESSANIKYLEISSGFVYGTMEVQGILTAPNLNLGTGLQNFGSVTISNEFTIKTNADVSFICNKPVQYITLSGNHINTFSLSCENLEVKQQADFSSINVSAEASFNTIYVIGEASFNTISAEVINIAGKSLQNFVEDNTRDLYSNYSNGLSVNEISSGRILIHKDIDNNINTSRVNLYNSFTTESLIDNLIITNSLDFSSNTGMQPTGFKLPFHDPRDGSFNSKKPLNNLKGYIFYNQNSNGVIDSIKIKKDNNDGEMTLSDNKTKSIMLKNINNDKNFVNLNGYECIKLALNNNELNNNSRLINIDGAEDQWTSNYISIPNSLTEENIEINANITVKLNNDNGGRDVDALNYKFYILGVDTDNLPFTYVENINSVLVFDNSYNYSSSSLHYIGPKIQNQEIKNVSYIYFGISYENNSLGISLEFFNGSIKTVI